VAHVAPGLYLGRNWLEILVQLQRNRDLAYWQFCNRPRPLLVNNIPCTQPWGKHETFRYHCIPLLSCLDGNFSKVWSVMLSNMLHKNNPTRNPSISKSRRVGITQSVWRRATG
jgi:hypothetical protein